jgi:hypothetical protein
MIKTSAQRIERLKVEEKILERPECTRRSREDHERIFDDGFESRSSCAEVFDYQCDLEKKCHPNVAKDLHAHGRFSSGRFRRASDVSLRSIR